MSISFAQEFLNEISNGNEMSQHKIKLSFDFLLYGNILVANSISTTVPTEMNFALNSFPQDLQGTGIIRSLRILNRRDLQDL